MNWKITCAASAIWARNDNDVRWRKKLNWYWCRRFGVSYSLSKLYTSIQLHRVLRGVDYWSLLFGGCFPFIEVGSNTHVPTTQIEGKMSAQYTRRKKIALSLSFRCHWPFSLLCVLGERIRYGRTTAVVGNRRNGREWKIVALRVLCGGRRYAERVGVLGKRPSTIKCCKQDRTEQNRTEAKTKRHNGNKSIQLLLLFCFWFIHFYFVDIELSIELRWRRVADFSSLCCVNDNKLYYAESCTVYL